MTRTKMSSSRKPKKGWTEASTSCPTTEEETSTSLIHSVPTFSEVRFREQFACLKMKQFCQPRTVDWSVLAQLRLEGEV